MIFRLHLTSGGHADIDTSDIEWAPNTTEQDVLVGFGKLIAAGGWLGVKETGQMINTKFVTYVEPLSATTAPADDIDWNGAAFRDKEGTLWFKFDDGRYDVSGTGLYGSWVKERIEELWGPLTYPLTEQKVGGEQA